MKRGSGRRRGGKADKDGTASADRGHKKLHRLKCYYCEGHHIQANSPEKSKDAPRPTTAENKRGGVLAATRVDKPAGADLWACDSTDATVRGNGERWTSDSRATETMTPDPTGFERYESAPPGRTVEMGDGGDGRRDAPACGCLRRPSSENRTGRRGRWPDGRSYAQARGTRAGS